MSWQCTLLEVVGTKHVEFERTDSGISGETRLVDKLGNAHSYSDLRVGTMFYVPSNAELGWPWYWASDFWLSDYYKQNNFHRRPLLIILPGRHLFSLDGKCWSEGRAYGGWTVTGVAPLITVSPSINIGGSYHGWLHAGILSDDCEGRKYDSSGNKQ